MQAHHMRAILGGLVVADKATELNRIIVGRLLLSGFSTGILRVGYFVDAPVGVKTSLRTGRLLGGLLA